ncbi:radical SAM protein [uncultured Desulfuromonas sp.]|uniref:B12-binding domain-containing radical SAM protein n=1 Tax=uncultured Desulfuromonas sp. TaxID=181013 RepID=UPI00262CDC84|nr:radical SAM protein [uncultured Desulfuromonas sp.]
MNVVFATPPITLEERYGDLAGAGSDAPSLGILLLAAVARQAGFDAAVLEASALGLSQNETLERIGQHRPDILALTSTTLSIFHAHSLADRAKARFPGLKVLIGGPHLSAAPRETMERFPAFDIAVQGEGEATIAELLQVLKNATPLEAVQGILFRDGEQLRETDRRPYIEDLDTLPFPAFDLLEGFPGRYAPAPFKTRQLPAASLVTSRGCPNECIFCDRSIFGSHCHAHSTEYVVDMIRKLHDEYGVREFSFEDDTFVTFKKRLREVCERLIELDLGISWSCLGRVDHVTSENLALMKKAGCWQISFGIESGDQQILNTIGKRVTLDQIRQAIAWTREAGIMAKGFFIVGHPGETRQTLRATLDFALELPLNDISVTMLTPFPGTELYDRADEFGTFDDDWAKLNLLNAVFVPRGLTRHDLEQAQRDLSRRFYLRPAVFADYLGRLARNPAMAGALWRGFRSFLKSVGGGRGG